MFPLKMFQREDVRHLKSLLIKLLSEVPHGINLLLGHQVTSILQNYGTVHLNLLFLNYYKRFPLFDFPRTWREEEENRKHMQSSYITASSLKSP
jgi:hypothetical protein